jgi:hypothetical protein
VFARAQDPVVDDNKPHSLWTFQSQIGTHGAALKYFLPPRTNGLVRHNGPRGLVWTEIAGAVDAYPEKIKKHEMSSRIWRMMISSRSLAASRCSPHRWFKPARLHLRMACEA